MHTFCEHTTRSVCAEMDVELTEFNGEADHVTCSWPIRQHWRSPPWCSDSKAARLTPCAANTQQPASAPACADTSDRRPTSPSPAQAHRCRSSSNTSTSRTAPTNTAGCASRQTEWTNPGLKAQACVQDSMSTTSCNVLGFRSETMPTCRSGSNRHADPIPRSRNRLSIFGSACRASVGGSAATTTKQTLIGQRQQVRGLPHRGRVGDTAGHQRLDEGRPLRSVASSANCGSRSSNADARAATFGFDGRPDKPYINRA